MAVRAFLVLCASALLQSACSAVVGDIAGPYGFGAGCGFTGPILGCQSFLTPGFAFEAPGFGCDCGGVASTGGGLPVTSASLIPPVGISVLSENAYEGALAAGGNLPFLGTVAIEGVLPTAGAGAVSYGCGDGACAIAAEEGAIATGIAPHVPAPYGAYGTFGAAPAVAAFNGFDGFGYGIGTGGYGAGCACGAIY